MTEKRLRIAIDGPASAGKSTVAKILAKDLGYIYCDTGAMYRALTYMAMENNISVDDEAGLVQLLQDMTITFDPSPYFRNDFRKTAWQYLTKNDISGLYRFILLFSVRWVLNRKLGMKTRKQDTYYFPQLFRGLIETRLDAYAEAVSYADGKLKLNVFSYKKMVGFEVRSISQPYASRKKIIYQNLSENEFQVTLSDGFDDVQNRIIVNFEDYSEISLRRR